MGLAGTNTLWSTEMEHSSPMRKQTSICKKYDRETLICQMIGFLTDNIYIKIGNHLFWQCIGIPMGTNCAPLLANLFLYSYEVEFLKSVKKSNRSWQRPSI